MLVAPVPLPKSKKQKTKASSAQKNRSPKNFLSWEDLLLCRAYVNVSQDPSVGCNQNLKAFWNRVAVKFNLLYYDAYICDEETDGVKALGGRTAIQLNDRFSKAISVDLIIFNKYFRQIIIENPSGVPLVQYPLVGVQV
jgi:hypothetical protein